LTDYTANYQAVLNLADPIAKLNLSLANLNLCSTNEIAHKESGYLQSFDIILGNFSHTLLVSFAMFRMLKQIFKYTNPFSCSCV